MRSHDRMRRNRTASLPQSVLLAVGLSILVYALTFGISMAAAFIGIRTQSYWLAQPAFLFCAVGLPLVTGACMAALPAIPRFWLGLLPTVFLCLAGSVLFYGLPCPVHHNFEFFAGLGGVVYSLPAAAAGWWFVAWKRRRRCEQHARQVSAEAAPSASPDEPSA